MERKTLGILALALVGLFAVSLVVAMPGHSDDGDAVRDAVEDGDYEAWRGLMMDQFSEEKFERMTQMYELRSEMMEARESGDYEAMETLRESMHEGMMSGGHMGSGMMGSRAGFGGGMTQHHEGCPFAN